MPSGVGLGYSAVWCGVGSQHHLVWDWVIVPSGVGLGYSAVWCGTGL